MFHEPVQNSYVICRVSVCQMGQDEVWRRLMAVLILCYGSHRPSDCPMRVLVAIMMLFIFLPDNELWKVQGYQRARGD